MNRPLLPRLGAACGVVFPIAMFLAVGNGNSFAPWRPVVATWALVLFLPFLAYLCGLLRSAEGEGGWLTTAALVAGISGVVLKLISHAPELAIHQDHLAKGTPLYKALDHAAGAATTLSLYPLAISTAAIAVLVLRTRILPRWLGSFAAVTALALAINGGFPSSSPRSGAGSPATASPRRRWASSRSPGSPSGSCQCTTEPRAMRRDACRWTRSA